MNRLFFALSVVALMVMLTACPYTYEPFEPFEDVDLKGAWTGTIKDSISGEGALVVTVTLQSDSGTLGGEWQADFGEGMTDGIFRGDAIGYGGDEFDLEFVPASAAGCILDVRGVRRDGELSATYAPSLSAFSDCTDAPLGVGSFLVNQVAEESP